MSNTVTYVYVQNFSGPGTGAGLVLGLGDGRFVAYSRETGYTPYVPTGAQDTPCYPVEDGGISQLLAAL